MMFYFYNNFFIFLWHFLFVRVIIGKVQSHQLLDVTIAGEKSKVFNFSLLGAKNDEEEFEIHFCVWPESFKDVLGIVKPENVSFFLSLNF